MSGVRHQLAQVNVALPVEPLTSATLAGFVALLEPVNALAESSPGFVWRLQTEDGDATAVKVLGDDRLIVNLTLWESLDDLAAFVFSGLHAEVLRQRRAWFTRLREPYSAAWWIPVGTRPTVADAEARLARLRTLGPTPEAFTLQRSFPAPGRDLELRHEVDWTCRA